MATKLMPDESASTPPKEEPFDGLRARDVLEKILRPLASLKLTIVLFALAIFIIFVGTLAQVDQDIWAVLRQYFRTWTAWVEWRTIGVLVRPLREVKGGFYFPGGETILVAMGVNLLAAHAVRFRKQAKGRRLTIGIIAIIAAIGFTFAVIANGNLTDGVQDQPLIAWPHLWLMVKIGLAGLVAAGVFALTALHWETRAGWWMLLAAVGGLGALAMWLIFGASTAGDPSAMRILWQLIQAAAAGLALLGACWLVFKKRAGIVLIHAGIGLMMFNEMYVYMTAVESQMRLREGEVHNYTEDIRTIELAVVDHSDPNKVDTVVIPKSFLEKSAVIRDAQLPFDVQVLEFFENADLSGVAPGDKVIATAGAGLDSIPIAMCAGTGVDTDSKVDLSAAYVKLLDKKTGKSLGTHLVSLILLQPDQVAVGGKTYDIALRFKRDYKPYVVRLDKTSEDDYDSTKIARNYSSDIHLIDPGVKADFKRHIWMNNPLRFGGETFYQSGFNQDGDVKTSVLSVVTNRGWMIPYVGCMIVVVGLLFHFMLVLTRFLRRMSASDKKLAAPEEAIDAVLLDDSPAESTWRTLFADFFPWVIVAVLAGWAISKAIPPPAPPDAMHLYEFGQLPIEHEGRVKPIDTMARVVLKGLSEKQSYTDDKGVVHPAVQWLLDLITDTEASAKQKVFRIDSPAVLATLALKPREGFRYSLDEFRDNMVDFQKQLNLAQTVDEHQRTAFQKQVLELAGRIEMYLELRDSFQPLPFPEMPTLEQAQKNPEAARSAVLESFKAWHEKMEQFHARMDQNPPPLVVPGQGKDAKWQPYAMAVDLAVLNTLTREKQQNPALHSLTTIFQAYSQGDVQAFNKDVDAYRTTMEKSPPVPLNETKVEFESFFNHFEPFYYGLVLYLTAFILACLGFLTWPLGWGAPLQRAAFWLISFTLVLHTAALIGRIYISGRPPVTTLYSAAVFIGWAVVIGGLAIEAIFKLGIGNLIAGFVGFGALLIAHLLASSGDTFPVLRAVLDTQFWLATHVVCITLGYSTTLLAGVLGLLYIILGMATPMLAIPVNRHRTGYQLFEQNKLLGRQLPRGTSTVGKILADMIYGVICFAIFFSFFGTVLGGLWADDSWGRFWGWDPKENGALIIVIWNALVLHARWDGIVKDRGLAVLAVGGNIAVGWSMFGVNQLGVGLHSYGFTSGVAVALVVFVATQAVMIAVGSLPKRFWRSYRALT